MNFIKGFLVLSLLFFSNVLCAQTKDIYEVKLTFHHSKRIVDNFVLVDIRRCYDSVSVSVKSLPMDTVSITWRKTMRAYKFVLSMADFEKIVASVKNINRSDIVNKLGVYGKDGTTCEIEIGGIDNSVSYRVWSPDYDTKQRHLQPFLNACKLILSTGRLNPEKILD